MQRAMQCMSRYLNGALQQRQQLLLANSGVQVLTKARQQGPKRLSCVLVCEQLPSRVNRQLLHVGCVCCTLMYAGRSKSCVSSDKLPQSELSIAKVRAAMWVLG